MASVAAAALLDELMGRNRNVLPDDTQNQLNWEDSEVCKLYLVKLCPHDLFVNTRADLGPCPKIHDDEMKQQYNSQNSYRKQSYEDEFIRFCQSMLNEVERKISKGKIRLSLNNKGEALEVTSEQQQKNEREISILSEKINKLVEDAEKAGIQGNVEQAQGLMKLCDDIKEERENLRKQSDNTHWQQTAELAAAQEKQMEVCEICGAFLIVGDAQQRIDDHLMGKQHMGYARLKQAVDEIMQNRQKTREEREKKRDEERKERTKLQKDEEKKREQERDERRKKRDTEEEDRRKRSKVRHRSRSPHQSHSRSSMNRSSRDSRDNRDRSHYSSNHYDKSRHGSNNRHSTSNYRGSRDQDRHRHDRGMNGDRHSRGSKEGGESGSSRGGSGRGGS